MPSRELLCSLFKYNPDTGLLYRNKKEVGSKTKSGHLNVGIGRKKYYVHRIIYKMVHDDEPPEVDHENKIKSDNKIKNLRPADDHKTQGNSPVHRHNISGLKGAQFVKRTGKYSSSIMQGCKKKHLGTFNTKEEAHEAYCEAARDYFGIFWSDGK